MKLLKNIFSFILKQLDKLLLAVVLLAFIFILFDLMNKMKQSDMDSTIYSPMIVKKTDYIPLDRTVNSADGFISESLLWEKSSKRNNDIESGSYIMAYSDFMTIFKIARSIANNADNKLIPYQNYLAGICPISNESLPKPDSDQLSMYTSSYDYDEDGIPDIMEKKYGLNPEFNQDAWFDSDNDSFSNIVEYRFNKEGILDPKIHPPLIRRIGLVRVASTKIPIIIKHILKTGYNKDNWKIQINIQNPGRRRKTKFLKINDNFEVNGVKYTINDIKEEYESVINPKLGVIERVDKSVVVLEDTLGQTINAVMEQPVFEPNRRVVIKDLYTGIEIITKVNNVITLGDDRIGIEKYKLISIDDNGRQLIFEDEKTNKKNIDFIVKRESEYKKPEN